MTQPAPASVPAWIMPRLFEDQTVVCIGGGPSLSQTQLDQVHASSAPAIAINNAYEVAPWAAILYGADLQWWEWHDGAREFEGIRITTDIKAAARFNLIYMPGDRREGFSLDPARLSYGPERCSNSGYQAINLAILGGARRILLIGYDMRVVNGAAHWFGEHPNGQRSPYAAFVRGFDTTREQVIRLGVEVVNCTPGSALKAYPFGDRLLKELL
jgi:hypothetical protein